MDEKNNVIRKESVKDYFHELAKTTKAHGFNKLTLFKSNLLLCIFWIAVLLTLAVLFAYNLYVITVTYLQVPMSTSFIYLYSENKRPAITLCMDDSFLFDENETNIIPYYNVSFKTVSAQVLSFWGLQFPNQSNLISFLSQQSLYPVGVKNHPNGCPSFTGTALFAYNGAV